MRALDEIAGAASLSHPSGVIPYHFTLRQTDHEFVGGQEVYPYLPKGFLVSGEEVRELAN